MSRKPRNDDKRSSGAALDAQRWDAVVARDKSADGAFFFSVSSTGVYCRPSCPSRRAKRENVAFHATSTEAEAAGFRPCRRCRPDEIPLEARRAQIVAGACRRLENEGDVPNLDELAKASGLSRFHFHRIFKDIVGVTPKDYALAHRRKNVRRELQRSASVTDAIYDAGFNSSSRFYASASEFLGMTPKKFRDGGKHEVLMFAFGQCMLGDILVAASAKGIAAILIGDDRDRLIADLRKIFPNAELATGDRQFEKTVARVVGLVDRPERPADLPLDIRGTAFQQRVWKALQEIPLGTTETYTDVANRLGNPKAVRAVARACATNPLAIVVPCHRVVRVDGSMAGFRWGIERKRMLIEREAANGKKPARRG
ncbi:bifunctional DNA-binding transcriptional regulator/O6-methylguanine-DNA methyltransferase Ada [Hyphomicrobium sp.]|jgi:AraC family transcriptional regulator of adaptative response/methylated-DNA-[protein]-cysteine methyltransferase|uniref:bifunctional DNA-binding transcriptional regulator/O6-methylguanine-DNA methyltransferase Ada n=1 Tax=Hyphomicrobium sp. TaxID=82 RepID=UPI00356716E3